MKAEERFEKLGYKLWKGKTDTFLLYQNTKNGYSIRFNIEEKSVSIFYNPDEDVYSQEIEMPFELFEAINQQMKEIGVEG